MVRVTTIYRCIWVVLSDILMVKIPFCIDATVVNSIITLRSYTACVAVGIVCWLVDVLLYLAVGFLDLSVENLLARVLC